jgi:hypothetical protein
VIGVLKFVRAFAFHWGGWRWVEWWSNRPCGE